MFRCYLLAYLLVVAGLGASGCTVKMGPAAQSAPPPEQRQGSGSARAQADEPRARDHRGEPTPQTYEDAQGNEVEMKSGARAFADRMTRFEEGEEPTDDDGARDPQQFIGAPNYERDEDGSYVTLGCRGRITVEFVDNAVVDADGADLYLFEIGDRIEPMSVEISTDGQQWIAAGDVKGQPAELDIASVADRGARYRFVRITDSGSSCGKRESPGADIAPHCGCSACSSR